MYHVDLMYIKEGFQQSAIGTADDVGREEETEGYVIDEKADIVPMWTKKSDSGSEGSDQTRGPGFQ